MDLQIWQWTVGAGAAAFIGLSKTGVPGVGILVVPMLAYAFGGRASVGIMLPMLIFADCFAVAWYKRHAQWDKLIGLLPWVVVGMAFGAAALWQLGEIKSSKDILGVVIGVLVLIMLALYYLQGKLGKNFQPSSRIGIIGTGTAAGFATTVSNAAGPVMSIYMAAQKMSKEQFMGTIAWYFFIINLSKVPVYLILTHMNPQKPIMNADSFIFTLMISPAILIGVFAGKWVLPRISQTAFDTLVVVLAAAAAIKLIMG